MDQSLRLSAGVSDFFQQVKQLWISSSTMASQMRTTESDDAAKTDDPTLSTREATHWSRHLPVSISSTSILLHARRKRQREA